MPSKAWGAAEVDSALRTVGVPEASTILAHVSLPLCGRSREGSPAAAFVEGVGMDPSRTLVLPAYTYSLSEGSVFDPQDEPTADLGLASVEAFRQNYERSLDPMFSMLANGPTAQSLFEGLPNRSFGPNTTFERLINASTWLVSVNLGAGCTLAHQIEFDCKVPHRYEKTFTGEVRVERQTRQVSWISYVRDLTMQGTRQDFRRVTEDLTAQGLFRRTNLGRGVLGAIRIDDYVDFIVARLAHETNYLTESGHPMWADR